MKKIRSKICLVCNKEYFKKKNVQLSIWDKSRWCSIECWKKRGFESATKDCPVCGKSFTLPVSIMNNNRGRERKTCSDVCGYKLITGKNHYRWTGEAPIHMRFRDAVRNLYQHKVWRNGVLKRDGFRCRVCQCAVKGLHVHHVVSFRKIIAMEGWNFDNWDTLVKDSSSSLLWDTNNGLSLCRDCHDDLCSTVLEKGNY